jgi:hypothetical protein
MKFLGSRQVDASPYSLIDIRVTLWVDRTSPSSAIIDPSKALRSKAFHGFYHRWKPEWRTATTPAIQRALHRLSCRWRQRLNNYEPLATPICDNFPSKFAASLSQSIEHRAQRYTSGHACSFNAVPRFATPQERRPRLPSRRMPSRISKCRSILSRRGQQLFFLLLHNNPRLN